MNREVESYLDRQAEPHQSTLQELRSRVLLIVPEAVDCISYGMPALRYEGKILLWYAAAKKHCALYPGGAVIGRLQKELANYSTSRGTIRFAPDRCLPLTLLRKITKMRLADLTAGRGVRSKGTAKKQGGFMRLKNPWGSPHA